MRIQLILVFIFYMFCSCKNEQNTDLSMDKIVENKTILIFVSSKKSIDFSSSITKQKIISEFGKPIQITKEKDMDLDGTEPWTVLKYDGVEITLEGNFISGITISNKNWTIDQFKIGDKKSKIQVKLGRSIEENNNFNLYLYPSFDGVFLCKFNESDEVTEFGISSPNC